MLIKDNFIHEITAFDEEHYAIGACLAVVMVALDLLALLEILDPSLDASVNILTFSSPFSRFLTQTSLCVDIVLHFTHWHVLFRTLPP